VGMAGVVETVGVGEAAAGVGEDRGVSNIEGVGVPRLGSEQPLRKITVRPMADTNRVRLMISPFCGKYRQSDSIITVISPPINRIVRNVRSETPQSFPGSQ
jgi:hypothetical protein